MSYKYPDGQRVEFDNGVIHGMGYILGVSSCAMPVIGCTYMIEVVESNIELPNEEYPYRAIPMQECHISDEFKGWA